MDLHYARGESFLRLIRSALAELLPGATFRDIDKTRRTLVFDTADGPVSLDDLSDGYQNVAAWVGDLLYRTTGAFDDFSNPLATRGLLLLDEIDLHLHVKWQRQLRQFIESKLPKFQIVATTHSPMTAQQAGRGEVHVLARPTPEAAPEAPGIRYRSRPARATSAHRTVLRYRYGRFCTDCDPQEAIPVSEGQETPLRG